MPGMFCATARLLPMALAAIAVVPKEDMSEATSSLPKENMLFSRPLGTPMRSMRPTMSPVSRSEYERSANVFFGLRKRKVITAPPTTRDMSVASPAPAAPMPIA